MSCISKKKRVIGIIIIAIGIGILLAVTVPLIGWMILAAIGLICCGIYILKC